MLSFGGRFNGGLSKDWSMKVDNLSYFVILRETS
jgi:hypothetical protein